MMKKVMSKNKGVTLVSLTIVITVLLILTGVIIYNVRDSLGVGNLQEMQNDVQNLRDLISDYYAENGKIPAKLKYTNEANMEKIRATGVISEKVDIGDFYIIDLKELENLTLNHGEDYKKITDATTEEEASQYEDIYIVNETSQNVFYVAGIQLDNEIFYTDYTSEDVDKVAINLRYFDGIKIPNGYIYNSGTSKEDLSIRNSSDATKIYSWVTTKEDIAEIPADVQIEESDQANFIESTNLFNGYYKSNTDNTAIYIVNEEKWSPTYDIEGTYKDKNGDTAYIPKGFQVSEKKGETLIDEGLVIRNATTDDRYVWIEVPKSVFTTVASRTDYEHIEQDLKNYTAEYKEGYEDYSDTWYEGCGIASEREYNDLKNSMYSSIFVNGGFYISQYEIGAETYVTSNDNGAREPESKKGLYPYNYVTIDQAQNLATNMDTGEKRSSLMFGIQWDLVCKFIESKEAKTQNQIKLDSSEWGNYRNVEFPVAEGNKYATYNSENENLNKWTDITSTFNKQIYETDGEGVALSTGATKRNSALNIYDFAGNVWEFTLEKNVQSTTDSSSTYRGGGFRYTGYTFSANNRIKNTLKYSAAIGFRTTFF